MIIKRLKKIIERIKMNCKNKNKESLELTPTLKALCTIVIEDGDYLDDIIRKEYCGNSYTIFSMYKGDVDLKQTIVESIPIDDTLGTTVQYNRKLLIPYLKKLCQQWNKDANYYVGDYTYEKREIYLRPLFAYLKHNSEYYDKVKASINREDLPPHYYLGLLYNFWDIVWDKPGINEVIEFIVAMTDQFPDTPQLRMEYRRLYNKMVYTKDKEENKDVDNR